MEEYTYIINIIIPSFLKSYRENYLVLGGKAYEYYFKSISTDDWDIIIDKDPKEFIELLKKYMTEKYDILLANLYETSATINGEKIYQLGYNPYQKKDNLFIDIKRDTLLKYGSIRIDGISIVSLSYLYKDGLETYRDRKANYESIGELSTDEDIIRSKIKYLKYTIRVNIPKYYEFIKHFYEDILPTRFNQSNKMIQSLTKNLEMVLNVYSINILSTPIDEDIRDDYEELDALQKYADSANVKNIKHELLHELVKTMDKFYKDKETFKNSALEISNSREFLKSQKENNIYNKIENI